MKYFLTSMLWSKLYLLLIIIFGSASHAQVEKLWEAYYTPSNDTLFILGSKADALGNLYTFGSEGRNLFLQKVNANGQIEWTITDNTLITPVPGDPFTENQLLQWARITDVATNSPGNNVVITGKAKFFNFNNSLHCFTIRFTPAGDTVWSRIYSNLDLITDGRIDPSSNPKILYSTNSLFIACLSKFGEVGNQDILLSRLDIYNGNILNYKNFSSKPVLGEFIENFTIKNGFFYLSGLHSIGRSFPASHPVGGWESFLIKLDTSFTLLAQMFEGDPSSLNYAIQHEIDNDGNIHLLLQSQDSLKSYQKTILLIKYDDNGTELWRFLYNDTINSNDSALLFNLDEQGNVRIVAQSTNHNRSLFFNLDSDGILKSVAKRDSISLIIQPIEVLKPTCNACPRIKTTTTHPVLSIHNSTYYYNAKIRSQGISKIYTNTKHWWDVDTLLVPGYAPMNIVFTDTFDFVTVALIDTLTDKKIQYRKYRDTSWLKIPFNLTTTAFSLHEIRLVWSALPDYKTDFIIERGLNDKDYIIIDTVSKQTLEYIDSNLDKNTLYYYRIRSVNQFGASLPSIPDSDITFDDVGIDNSLFTKTVKIYPNPTFNQLFIDFSEKGNYEIIVVDITGKKQFITHTKEMKNEMNLGELKSGVYFLRINNAENQQSFTFKIVKP